MMIYPPPFVSCPGKRVFQFSTVLYTVTLNDNHEKILFDSSRTGFLCAIDKTEGRIVRYDLSWVEGNNLSH